MGTTEDGPTRSNCPQYETSHTVRNITIRLVRYSLRPLVFDYFNSLFVMASRFFNSLFVTDPVSNAGLGSSYTVFPFKTKTRSADFFHVLDFLWCFPQFRHNRAPPVCIYFNSLFVAGSIIFLKNELLCYGQYQKI